MKIRVAGLVISKGHVLLMKHKRRGRTYWTLPGGRLEEGETLQQALLREIEEETGLKVTLDCLLFVADTISPHNPYETHVVNILFKATCTSAQMAIQQTEKRLDESNDNMEFVPLASLKDIPLYPPIVSEIVAALEAPQEVPARYLGNVWEEMDTSD